MAKWALASAVRRLAGVCYCLKVLASAITGPSRSNRIMKDADALDVLIRQRLEALVRDLPSARGGDIEALHRTRIASRRMREALPFVDSDVARREDGPCASHGARPDPRRSVACGNSDVAQGILSERPTGTPARRRVVERVRAQSGAAS